MIDLQATVCPKDDVTFDFTCVSFIYILRGCDCIYLFTKIGSFLNTSFKLVKFLDEKQFCKNLTLCYKNYKNQNFALN